MNDALIRRYYECFNERRFADAAALLTDDALLEIIPVGQEHGAAGYLRFADAWIAAQMRGRWHRTRSKTPSEHFAL